jgi:hypothetical protein
MNDFRTKESDAQALIKSILLRDWDPIGVSQFPEAQDEYDTYVPEVYRMLSRRAEVLEVFEYLFWLETKHMGLSGNRPKTEKIAERLAALGSEDR